MHGFSFRSTHRPSRSADQIAANAALAMETEREELANELEALKPAESYFPEIAAKAPVAIPDPHAPRIDSLSGGVSLHSTEIPYKNYIVFAVGGLLRAAQFVQWLEAEGLRYDQGVGSYKGQQERCFIMEADDRHRLAYWLAGQETVLWLGPNYRPRASDGLKAMHDTRRAYLCPVSGGGHVRHADGTFVGFYGHVVTGRGSELEPSRLPVGDWTWLPGNGFYAVLSHE